MNRAPARTCGPRARARGCCAVGQPRSAAASHRLSASRPASVISTVGGHPVANAQLADEPERVAGPGALAVHGERARPRLDLQRPESSAASASPWSAVGRSSGCGPACRSGSSPARRLCAARSAAAGPSSHALGSPERRAPDSVALLAQPSAQIVDPSPRTLAFRARGSRNLVDIDLGEPLDRPPHLIGERPRDVLEAAAIRIIVTHGPIIARDRSSSRQ